ncbi:MAG: CtkA family protein [Clostridiales bacterium]|nr:CtkA family protein [Clostridiales bacterium]
MSYTNSCISEYIASNIFNIIGLNAHKTLLGIYYINGKEKIVCACRDFTAHGERLYDFASIKNTIIDSEHMGTGTKLDDILETIEKQKFLDPVELKSKFWDMFVVDAFLGNFDRHNGNWGFLVDTDGNSQMAPIFDCGSCLLPQADDAAVEKVLNDPAELNSRIYRFPTSAIKIGNRKINYFDFLTSGTNEDCNEAVKRIVPKINLDKIYDFINTTPYISELQKDFCKNYLFARYEKILSVAYNNVIDLESSNEDEGFVQSM